MKSASKAFIIFKTVLSAIILLMTLYALLNVIFAIVSPTPEQYDRPSTVGLYAPIYFTFFGAIIFDCVVTLTLGIAGIVKLNRAKCEKDVPIALGVFIIIFNSIIGGILMLCLKDEHLMPKEHVEYKKLLNDGIITKEEYDAKAASINK